MVMRRRMNVGALMFDPAGAFEELKDEELGGTFSFYFRLLIVFAVLFAAIAATAPYFLALLPEVFPDVFLAPFAPVINIIVQTPPPLIFGGVFVALLVGGTLGMLVAAVWLHIWVYAFGGRRGFKQTLKAYMLGMTPLLILGWIPVINVFGAIWAILAVLNGIMQLHEMYSGAAILALLFSLIIPGVAALAVGLVAMPYFMPYLGVV
ncbi:MAG: GTPase-interacting Yip1 domain [Candidatus Alkanophagales archaeon MCA70_species_2]|nr:GTPase-interacting Yip1 domain [Candidatus Alkanophaga liquidiphilum]